MELWIRTQNKHILIKATKLYISRDDRKYTIWQNGTESSYEVFLGGYATKERCLEVLDEIQNALKNGQGNVVVYEMPKE